VVGEVTLSFALLATAGMVAKGPLEYGRRDPGLDSTAVLTAEVSLRRERYAAPEDWARFFEALLPRIEAIGGVQAATLASSLPGLEAPTSQVRLRGAVYERDEDVPGTRLGVVATGYFSALGVAPVEGRLFDARDGADGQRVAVVNRSFAARFFPVESPLGRQFTAGAGSDGPWLTVVGVVPDLRMNGPKIERPDGIYLPLTQRPRRSANLVIRAAGAPVALAGEIRRVLAELDPDLPLMQVRSLRAALVDEIRPELVFLSLLAASGLIALVLAAVGLFGVLAFSVRQQTREIGIRMALGAGARSVLWRTVSAGMGQVGVGLVTEQLASWGVYGAVAGILAGTGLAASLLPAAHASRVSPVEALRQE